MVLNLRKLQRYISRGIHKLEVDMDMKYEGEVREVVVDHTMYRLSKEYGLKYEKPNYKMSEHEQDSVDIVSQNARDLIEAIE
jgi:transposase